MIWPKQLKSTFKEIGSGGATMLILFFIFRNYLPCEKGEMKYLFCFFRGALYDLQGKYVIVPIDKATGNVALVCKRFYDSVLVEELRLVNQASETYVSVSKKLESIVKKNIRDLKNECGIEVTSVNHCLPHIYWLPKLHKSPLKFRFIIAAPKCSIKPFKSHYLCFSIILQTYWKL